MSDTLKCTCSNCGAKYRLPVEAQGRSARCKKCGHKFSVPRLDDLEDSILAWLNEPEPDEDESIRPRVISMGGEAAAGDAAKRARGPIRMKTGTTDEPE